jgi:methyltransferase-like protein
MEQYMDFVRCRYFRKTLLCHGGVRLKRNIDGGTVKGLRLSSNAQPVGTLALEPTERVTFETGGSKLMCKAPLTKLAIQALAAAWPAPVPFGDLLAGSLAAAAAAGYPHDAATAEDFLAGEMLTAIGAGLVEWRVTPAPFTVTVGERPQATGLARLQATQEARATNLRGEMVSLDEIHRQVLRRLDGERTLADIGEELMGALRKGDIVLQTETGGAKVTGEAQMRDVLLPALGKVMENLSRQAFLVAARA